MNKYYRFPQIEVFSHKNGFPYIEESPDKVMDTRPLSQRSPPLSASKGF